MNALSRIACCCILLLFITSESEAAEWTEFPSVRESRFPHGFEVVDSNFNVLKTVDGFQMANVKAFQDIKGIRHYLSDWSFERLREGKPANLIRAIEPSSPEPDILDHIASPAEQRIRRRIEDSLDLAYFGDLDFDSVDEFSGKFHFYDVVFAHHPQTYTIYKKNGEGYGLGHIFSTPFDLDKTCETIEWASGSSQGIENAVNQALLKNPHAEAFLDSLPEVFQAVVDIYRFNSRNRTANKARPNLAMPPQSAYVEFVRTHSNNYTSAYTANVYKSGRLIDQKELFDARAFDVFVELLLRNATKRNVVDSADASEWLDGFFTEVYEKTFKQFEHQLQGVDTVYWNGNGFFHFVPLEIIIQHTGGPLSEKPLIRVRDASSLSKKESHEAWRDRGVFLVGDLDFNHDLLIGNQKQSASGLRSAVERAYARRQLHFPDLPGTREEIERLETLLEQSGSLISVSTIRQLRGTESAIVEQLPKFGVVHLATHGFYLDDRHLTDTYSTDPYVRSGLTLTGANQTFRRWQRSDIHVDRNDGVLLAAEFKDLDLSEVQLIVLSACSTAEGKPFDNGAVLSLQSAVLDTKVTHAVTTLWAVSDGTTPALMQLMYEQLLSGNDPATALWNSRRTFFEKIEQSSNLWIAMQATAPFICVSQAVSH